MKRLTVFYDAKCGLCGAVRQWLEREPKFVTLQFVPYDSPEAEVLFPQIKDWHPESEILALSDEGGIYQGASAWIICLWATVNYRTWALRFASPVLNPFAEKFCRLVARNRISLSRFLRLRSDEALKRGIDREQDAESLPCRLSMGVERDS